MRLGSAIVALLGMILGLTCLSVAKVPAGTENDKSESAIISASADLGASSAGASGEGSSGGTTSPAPANPADPAPAQTAGSGKSSAKSSSDNSSLAPAAATSGSLGLFTQETADLLPKGGWTITGFANKFTRMPASTTILQYGFNVGVGITDWLNVSLAFDPVEHTGVSVPSQLSLNQQFEPQFGNSIFPILPGSESPGYVEDYPFASHNGNGVGPVELGVKLGLLSEKRGSPISLSLRNELYIPTVSSFSDLMSDQVQNGAVNDQIMFAASKDWRGDLVMTTNFGVMLIPGRTFSTPNGTEELDQAQQVILGVGFLSFPRKRIQLMSEYNAVIFASKPANTTLDARDPVDAIWGVRLYPSRRFYIDAGYRSTFNLQHAVDRNGFVIKVGTGVSPMNPAPPVNHSPVAACSMDKTSVFAGANDAIAVTTTAADPDGDPLTYSWTATGGSVNGTGPNVRWLSSGVMPGNYTITVTVSDGRGGTATCSVNPVVAVRPNRPPTVSLNSNRNTVLVGEKVQFTAVGADPDNDPLSYTWRANCGQLNANNISATLDTAGAAPGTCTVTVRVDDGRGGAADAAKGVNIQTPPPPPQASKLNSCDFNPAASPRVDNVCKRILDDVALRLQNEPRATVVIIGYADPKQRQADKVAGSRADNTGKYLTDKGLDRSRIVTRTGAGQAGAADNSRIDIIWVPQGASY